MKDLSESEENPLFSPIRQKRDRDRSANFRIIFAEIEKCTKTCIPTDRERERLRQRDAQRDTERETHRERDRQ